MLDARRPHWLECRAILQSVRDARFERLRITCNGTPEEVSQMIETELESTKKLRCSSAQHGDYPYMKQCPFIATPEHFEIWITKCRRELIERAESDRIYYAKKPPPVDSIFDKLKDEPQKTLERAWRYVEDIYQAYAIRNSKRFREQFCGCNGYVTLCNPSPGTEFPTHIEHFRYGRDTNCHADRVETNAPENSAVWIYRHFLGEIWNTAINATHTPHPLATPHWMRH